jgi:hypothetical protein
LFFGFLVFWFFGFLVFWFLGFWVFGFLGFWVFGFVGVRIFFLTLGTLFLIQFNNHVFKNEWNNDLSNLISTRQPPRRSRGSRPTRGGFRGAARAAPAAPVVGVSDEQEVPGICKLLPHYLAAYPTTCCFHFFFQKSSKNIKLVFLLKHDKI